MQIKSDGGSSETLANALTVMPRGSPSLKRRDDRDAGRDVAHRVLERGRAGHCRRAPMAMPERQNRRVQSAGCARKRSAKPGVAAASLKIASPESLSIGTIAIEIRAVFVGVRRDEDDVEIAMRKVFEQLERRRIEDLDEVVFGGAPKVRAGDVGARSVGLDRPNPPDARLSQRHPERRIAVRRTDFENAIRLHRRDDRREKAAGLARDRQNAVARARALELGEQRMRRRIELVARSPTLASAAFGRLDDVSQQRDVGNRTDAARNRRDRAGDGSRALEIDVAPAARRRRASFRRR